MTTDISAPVAVATPAPMSSTSHITLMHRPYGPRIHMDEDAAAAAPATPLLSIPADAPATFNSPSDAARFLGSWRTRNRAEASASAEPAVTKPAAERADEATADPESAQADADPAEQPSLSEEPEGEEPEAEKLPPIPRPRSWSKDDEEEWLAIPRARQEKISANEQAREVDHRQRTNDVAEKLKGLTAKEQLAEQARQKAESDSKAALQVLEREQRRDFPDITSMEDLNKLHAEAGNLTREAAGLWATDPFTAGQLATKAALVREHLADWDRHQREMQARTAEVQKAETDKATARQTEARERKAREHNLLIEKAPEFADAKKMQAAQTAAVELFRDKGCTDEWFKENGDNPLLDDHRFQLIISDALKFNALQNTPKPVPAKKPVPPVQRPGTPVPRGATDSERTKALDNKLSSTGSLRAAQELIAARRAARR